MAEEGQVISCHTIEAWNEQLQKGLETKKLIAVDFTASWCPPCRLMAPIFADCAKIFTNVIFLKVDVDELKSVAQDWAVEAMPTFIFIKDGNILETSVGAKQKDEFQKIVSNHATATATATTVTSTTMTATV